VVELQILGASAITALAFIAVPDEQTGVVVDSIILARNSGAPVPLFRVSRMIA